MASMDRLLSDLRHGARVLIKTPGVTITALLALALAIGANTAMFTVVDAVLVRPLPFEDPDRVVMIWEDASKIGFPTNTPAPANWNDWRKLNTVFTDIAATSGAAYTLTGDGPPDKVFGRRVTANFWTVLKAKPLLGRTFSEEEDRTNAKVAVIGHGLWKQRFGADAGVVGRTILVDGEAFTIVGVMRPDFSFPNRRTQMWTPAAMTPAEIARRGSHYLICIGRIRSGVTLQQAQAEMRVIAQRLAQQYPESNRDVGAVVVPIADEFIGKSRTGIVALFAASGFVLLIACANIANLLLARAPERRREIAVRSALGAAKAAIVRQLLTESLLLACSGALLGIVVARVAMIAAVRLIPPGMAVTQLQIDWRMLLFTTVIAVATGVFFGIFPALSLGRAELNEGLRESSRTATGGHQRFRDGLAVAQIALALTLLTGAGLMLQTLNNLRHVDLGMRTEGVLTASTVLTRTRYPDHGRQADFAEAVLRNVMAIPGVISAGYTSALPLTTQGNTNSYILQGQTQAEGRAQDALMRVITPEFMQTLGATLREGRFFTNTDRATTEPVVIVNETFANAHGRGISVLGKRLAVSGGPDAVWMQIVGVVKEIRERGVNIDTKPAMYIPLAQSAKYWPTPSDLVIRTSVKPESVIGALQRAVWDVDKDQPLSNVRTMEEVVDEQFARELQQVSVLSVFGGLAILLAATGLYGVVSYVVTQRRREFGIRMALGATPGNIMSSVVRRGAAVVGVGILSGCILSSAAARVLSTLLYGIQPKDPAVLAAAAAMLSVIGLAACLLPARTASAMQPYSVLRNE